MTTAVASTDGLPYAIAVGGTLGGVLLGGVLQGKRERTARREERDALREARREERMALREAETDAFEREQILRLQERLLDLVKLTGHINDRRLDEYLDVQRWPTVRAIGMFKDYVDARFDAITSVGRMLRLDLQTAARAVIDKSANVVQADFDSQEAVTFDLDTAMKEAMNLLGARLGELYRREN